VVFTNNPRRTLKHPVRTRAADVVILEGIAGGSATDSALIAQYDEKYTWKYSAEECGPLTTIFATQVLAWRAMVWAGRDGIQSTGRWAFAVEPRDK
jgi:hypothetical protein